MASIVNAIGYALGKLHAGMLTYLCDLHREGDKEPLRQVLQALNLPVPHTPVAKREWNGIDLAIFDGDPVNTPSMLVEIKVDDHEHATRRKVNGHEIAGVQTKVYAQAYPDCPTRLFLTLGFGEAYGPPAGPFRWIRTAEFYRSLTHIRSADPVLTAWREAIAYELRLREAALANDRSESLRFRGGAWNLYVLGALRDDLSALNPSQTFRCYAYGSAPDTILNLGWDLRPTYAEINKNGRLNLKIVLQKLSTEERDAALGQAQDKVHHIPNATMCKPRINANSATFARFDVGLRRDGDRLVFDTNRANTVKRIQAAYTAFRDVFVHP